MPNNKPTKKKTAKKAKAKAESGPRELPTRTGEKSQLSYRINNLKSGQALNVSKYDLDRNTGARTVSLAGEPRKLAMARSYPYVVSDNPDTYSDALDRLVHERVITDAQAQQYFNDFSDEIDRLAAERTRPKSERRAAAPVKAPAPTLRRSSRRSPSPVARAPAAAVGALTPTSSVSGGSRRRRSASPVSSGALRTPSPVGRESPVRTTAVPPAAVLPGSRRRRRVVSPGV